MLCEPNTIYHGDVRDFLREVPDLFFDLAVTSPPYWNLREYTGQANEIGLEKDIDAYLLNLLAVFDLLAPKLKDSGSLWVNIADTYRKGPLEIPQRFSYLMRQTRGWHLINAVIWYKVDAQAESCKRRFSQKYEMFYWFVKDYDKYYFNLEASKIPVTKATVERMNYTFNKGKGTDIARMRGMLGDQSEKIEMYLEKGVNAGDLWALPTNKDKVKHAAPYPVSLIVRPILACCPPEGNVFDPFMGSGTTALAVARMGEGRKYYGADINGDSVAEANERLHSELIQGQLL